MTERKRLLLRLDPAVHAAIAKWAADDLRSVNAQIEYALRRALAAAGRATPRPAPGRGSSDADADAENAEPGGADSAEDGSPDASTS